MKNRDRRETAGRRKQRNDVSTKRNAVTTVDGRLYMELAEHESVSLDSSRERSALQFFQWKKVSTPVPVPCHAVYTTCHKFRPIGLASAVPPSHPEHNTRPHIDARTPLCSSSRTCHLYGRRVPTSTSGGQGIQFHRSRKS